MNKSNFINFFLLTITILFIGIELFTDYPLNKWLKAIGFLSMSFLSLIDLKKEKE
jgi:hypothetical protein